MDPAVAFRRPSAYLPRTRPSVLQDNEVPIFGSEFNLFRQLHEKSRVLQDDLTQNNRYLIEIPKFNNYSQRYCSRPCGRRSETKLRCTFGAAPGSKNLQLTEKAPLAGGCNLGRRDATKRQLFMSCSGAIRRKIPVRHLILFKFFEISWLAGDVRLSRSPPLYWLMSLGNFYCVPRV